MTEGFAQQNPHTLIYGVAVGKEQYQLGCKQILLLQLWVYAKEASSNLF